MNIHKIIAQFTHVSLFFFYHSRSKYIFENRTRVEAIHCVDVARLKNEPVFDAIMSVLNRQRTMQTIVGIIVVQVVWA